jgi:hypothetical protein
VAKLSRLSEYVSPTELAAAVATLKRRIAGDASASGAPGVALASVDAGPASPDEKKKPEPPGENAPLRERTLPPQLSAAFDSLAATAELSRAEAEQSKAEAERPKGSASQAREATRPSPQAGSGVLKDSAEAEAPTDSLRAAVIEALGRASPLLKTGLASSLPWRVEEKRLVIPFRSGMEESVVRGSIAEIAAKASEFAGRQLRVELKVELKVEPTPASSAAGKAGEGEPDPVEIVERVFRGARLPDRG